MPQHFIGYRMFAALDSRGTGEQEQQRESALRLEFIVLVPTAGRLKASELVLQRHHTDQGCKLEYYLVLSPQTGFDFDGTGEPPPAGARELADFRIEVAGVTTECKNVKTRLVLAHSPGLGHRELAQDSPAMVDTRALRTLFRRRARQVVMPTPEGGLVLDLPPVPTNLPTGIECSITARTTKLTPDHMAHLRDLAWKQLNDEPNCAPVTLPETAVAKRKGLSDEDTMRLLAGMDARTSMRLGVSIEFDWATGMAKDFALLSVANA